MRRKLVGLAVTALLVGGSAHTAAAQARGYVGFGAGVNIPLGDFKDGSKMGWLGQVLAGVTAANGMWGGRIDGMYARHSFKGTSNGHTTLFGANADVVLTPGKRPAKVHPYLLAGVGFYNAKFEVANVSNSETKFAWNGGAGLQIHAGSRMDVYTEVRFISVSTSGGSTHFIPISIGLRFGGV